jgi:hypothetical protein
MKAASLLPLTLGLLASLLAVACSSSTEGTDQPVEDPEAIEDEVRASCTNPRRYFVTFREGSGTCAPIAGHRGQWVPEALFPDAPADVQASTCIYAWSGEKYSRADRDAIATAVGESNGLAPACGSSSLPDIGALEPIPDLDVWGHAGSVGCDVCGVLRRGRLWVILPPERVASRQFQVQLSNGENRAFQIGATNARALSITLPTPPAGTSYQQGRVQIY